MSAARLGLLVPQGRLRLRDRADRGGAATALEHLDPAPSARYVEFAASGLSPDLEDEERFAELALDLTAEAA